MKKGGSTETRRALAVFLGRVPMSPLLSLPVWIQCPHLYDCSEQPITPSGYLDACGARVRSGAVIAVIGTN